MDSHQRLVLESMDVEQHGTATTEWLDDAFLILRSEFVGQGDQGVCSAEATRTSSTSSCTTTAAASAGCSR